MIRRIKYIILSILILSICFAVFTIFKTNKTERIDKISKVFTEKEIEKFKNFRKDFYKKGKIIRFIEKNGDWSDIPLTDNFRKKYNEKDGILKDIIFDKVEYCPYEDGEYPFAITSYFVITQGKKKTAYQFSEEEMYDENTKLSFFDDIKLSEPIVFVDEDGNDIDTRLACNSEENWDFILSYGFGNDEIRKQAIGFTENFENKYEDLFDTFLKKIHTEKYDWPVGMIFSSYNEKYVDVKWKHDGFEHKYRVSFILDEKYFIDDVEIIQLD